MYLSNSVTTSAAGTCGLIITRFIKCTDCHLQTKVCSVSPWSFHRSFQSLRCAFWQIFTSDIIIILLLSVDTGVVFFYLDFSRCLSPESALPHVFVLSSFSFCPLSQTGCKTPQCIYTALHAHHPRDCLFYLRDWEPPRLQALLQVMMLFRVWVITRAATNYVFLD